MNKIELPTFNSQKATHIMSSMGWLELYVWSILKEIDCNVIAELNWGVWW